MASLGFPRAMLVPLQQNSLAIALWELRERRDRDPGLWQERAWGSKSEPSITESRILELLGI